MPLTPPVARSLVTKLMMLPCSVVFDVTVVKIKLTVWAAVRVTWTMLSCEFEFTVFKEASVCEVAPPAPTLS